MRTGWRTIALAMVGLLLVPVVGNAQTSSQYQTPYYDNGNRYLFCAAYTYRPYNNEQFWGVAGVSINCYNIPCISNQSFGAFKRYSTMVSDPIEIIGWGQVRTESGGTIWQEIGSYSNTIYLPRPGYSYSTYNGAVNGTCSSVLGTNKQQYGGVWWRWYSYAACWDDVWKNPGASTSTYCWFNCACTCY
jgi:hypothetical protein